MTTQLYRVMTDASPSQLVMIAPASTIQDYFGCHRDAINRMMRETAPDGGVCHLFQKGGCVIVQRSDIQ